jgi:hypothetical protein
MTTVQAAFGKILATAIRTAELTNRAFARQQGVHQPSLQQMIAGRRKPKAEDIEPWADALGLRGVDRAAFVRAGWLALTPAPIVALVTRLQAENLRLRRSTGKVQSRRKRQVG